MNAMIVTLLRGNGTTGHGSASGIDTYPCILSASVVRSKVGLPLPRKYTTSSHYPVVGQMKRVILCLYVLPVTLRSLHEKVEDGKGRGGRNLCDSFIEQRAWGHARKNSGSNGVLNPATARPAN